MGQAVPPKRAKNRTYVNRTVGLVNFEESKKEIVKIVSQHKSTLKQIVEKEKRTNEEFFNVMHYLQTGGKGLADNKTAHALVTKKGINLMLVPADDNPSLFGRKLAVVMFGEKGNCELRRTMIGRRKSGWRSRPLVSKEDQKMFETVVKRKFPSVPNYAYDEARKAANQMGVDLRRRFPSPEAREVVESELPESLDPLVKETTAATSE